MILSNDRKQQQAIWLDEKNHTEEPLLVHLEELEQIVVGLMASILK